MVFNSISFLYFIVIFFVIYFLLSKSVKLQNIFILIASFIFYAYWDYRFLFLLLLNIFLDYSFGLAIFSEINAIKKKRLIVSAVALNLGILFFFKYFNFFIDSVNQLGGVVGMPHINGLNILLPIGISFYTFHSLSYTIDIYNRKLEPTRNIVAYASFVCFFPQLVAGPISRARDILPKFINERKVDGELMIKGTSQIILGFFKKMVIADSIAAYIDPIYANIHVSSDLSILIVVVLYSFQIYCDFSGYTDIALGLGKVFGITFKDNFDRPYFAKNFSEFWNKWHISLSSWLRDYLYIPLGGNRYGTTNTYINLMLTMVLGGLWHGASYNFIIWGILHGTYLIMQRIFPIKIPTAFAIVFTFSLTTFAWIFFRSHHFDDSIFIIRRIFSLETTFVPNPLFVIKLVYLLLILFLLDTSCYKFFDEINTKAFSINILLLLHLLLFSTFSGNGFIYFQF